MSFPGGLAVRPGSDAGLLTETQGRCDMHDLYDRRCNLKFASAIVLSLGLLLIAGCSGGRASRVSSSGGANSYAERQARPPEYRIGILDELEIRFGYHERFNETAKVRPDGRITIENLGDVYVVGLTPTELRDMITDAYAKVVFNPEITVFVRGFASQSIYVLGEVDRPGMVELRPQMNALKAIAAVGGPVSGAKLNSVIVLRQDELGELRGIRVNLNRGMIAEAAVSDVQLQPQDVVFVPRTFIASVTEFLTQVYAGLFPPIDIYLRGLREYNRKP